MKKSIFVDLSNIKSITKVQMKLHNTWGFSNTNIAEIMEKYQAQGCVEQFGEVHYRMLSDLIDGHMAKFDNYEQKEAYVVSKKANMLACYNPKGVKEAGAFAASLISLYVSNIVEGGKPVAWVAVALLIVWGAMASHSAYLMASPGRQFYQELFAYVEKRYLKQ